MKQRLVDVSKDVPWLLLKFLVRVTAMVTDADAGTSHNFQI
jgi:hypothetical protein